VKDDFTVSYAALKEAQAILAALSRTATVPGMLPQLPPVPSPGLSTEQHLTAMSQELDKWKGVQEDYTYYAKYAQAYVIFH